MNAPVCIESDTLLRRSAEQDDLPQGMALPTDCELAMAESRPLILEKELWRAVRRLGIGRIESDDPLDFLCAEPVVFRGDKFDLARELRDAAGADLAVLVPARDEFGAVTDIAAWIPETGKLALWRGAVAMIGQHNIFDPLLDEPIFVHESIAEWLRCGRRGVFIVRPLGAALLFASFRPTLGVRSESFGRRLRTTLIIPAPRVLVSTGARAA